MSETIAPAAGSDATIDEICVVACAETWRGDGEIFASGMGPIPSIAARLARASFEPDLLLSDGEAFFIANNLRFGTFGINFYNVWYRQFSAFQQLVQCYYWNINLFKP